MGPRELHNPPLRSSLRGAVADLNMANYRGPFFKLGLLVGIFVKLTEKIVPVVNREPFGAVVLAVD